jgi:solute carrier family 35 protein E1
VKYEKPDKEFLKAVTLPAFLHAFGHCLTNVSFAAVAVSFTHTIKTLEPVFTSIGSYALTGGGCTSSTQLTTHSSKAPGFNC